MLTIIKVMLERAEKEYYSEAGFTEQTLDELRQMCSESLTKMPYLNMSIQKDVQTCEEIISRVESNAFMKIIMRDVYRRMKEYDLDIENARKFMLKCALCASTYHSDSPEAVFLYVYAVLSEKYSEINPKMFIDKMVNDKGKSLEVIEKMNELKIPVKEIVKIIILSAICILIICMIIRVIQIRRKVRDLRSNLKGMKEVYEKMKVVNRLRLEDDVSKRIGRNRVQKGFVIEEDV